ncbi:hypothetical protein WR25_06234 [Diploscapter pachys]|uniref:Uncharacterized protein n=1 Tax=Diploscapter pachys TaxID=2018661 RepID=A0A2A2LX39_9BILA|nr:hypothetical protein WR25_06234 [Diploscapter pachys]
MSPGTLMGAYVFYSREQKVICPTSVLLRMDCRSRGGKESAPIDLEDDQGGGASKEENTAMDDQLGEDEEHQHRHQAETAHRFKHYQLK